MIRLVCIILLAIFTFVPTILANDEVKLKEQLSKQYKLERPDGVGPFPAVMMIPGCSGFDGKFRKKHYDGVQKRLVELGFVTLRVNSLAARNATNCRQDMLFPWDGASDIYIAAEYLLQQSFVKKGAINIIGWSWGGAAALLALRPAESQSSIPINAVVAYYPACDYARNWESEVPVLVLGGSLDDIAPFSKCETIFSTLPKRNKLTVRVYDGAHHSFDNSELPNDMEHGFGTIGYNETAAKSAWMEVTKFLHN